MRMLDARKITADAFTGDSLSENFLLTVAKENLEDTIENLNKKEHTKTKAFWEEIATLEKELGLSRSFVVDQGHQNLCVELTVNLLYHHAKTGERKATNLLLKLLTRNYEDA